MRFRPGQLVIYKNHTAEIEFCFPEYKKGKKYMKSKTQLHRLCFEDELLELDQISIQDIIK